MECKNCAKYKGDCGHHFKDFNNHIHYDIPSEAAGDKYGGCEFYEENRSGVEIAVKELMDSNISTESKLLLGSCVQEILKAQGKCIVCGKVVSAKGGCKKKNE